MSRKRRGDAAEAYDLDDDAEESHEGTEGAAPLGDLPPAEPRLGPQIARKHRAAYHVKTGVAQLLAAKRAGAPDAEFAGLAQRLLSRAYGIL